MTRSIHLTGPLEEVFTFAVASRRLYDDLSKDIEESATEAGELETLLALRKAMDKV